MPNLRTTSRDSKRKALAARIVELDIAAEMGTSQGPVRKTLQKLEREGLVERRARRETVVTNVSLGEIDELFAIRSLIESFTAGLVSEIIKPEHCLEL